MGKPGQKPQRKVKIKWSPEFAYAIGLLTTDGNLSKDGRHFDFTSQDRDLILLLMRCLGINNRITTKIGGYSKKPVTRIQFGDVIFYKFLVELGLHPNKSKTLDSLAIPHIFFPDFLRGHFDGDGTFYSYWDPRWRSSFMFYLEFISASRKHIEWLREKISQLATIRGHITKDDTIYHLKYAKSDTLKLLPKLYYNNHVVCLSRKRSKIEKALRVVNLTI